MQGFANHAHQQAAHTYKPRPPTSPTVWKPHPPTSTSPGHLQDSPTCRVLHLIVVLSSLKVGKRGMAGCWEWHDIPPPVYQALVIDLTKHPPREEREGGSEGGRKGGREGGTEERRDGGREEGREGGREDREGGWKGGRGMGHTVLRRTYCPLK